MTDQLLAALALYGLPVLFIVVAVASVGIPFPISLLLVAAGSFVEQGEMKLVSVILVASVASVLGDNAGYFLGRKGGRRFILRISKGMGGETKVRQAENFSKRWGALGIFLSRWLITVFAPWINFASGIGHYPWRRFILWDVLGEVLWVLLYVGLGYAFSDRVQMIADVLGNLVWVVVGLLTAAFLGWKLWGYLRSDDEQPETKLGATPPSGTF
ncbi:MAG TPA: DedA family protein [Pyrinomonadaceae bacterium]